MCQRLRACKIAKRSPPRQKSPRRSNPPTHSPSTPGAPHPLNPNLLNRTGIYLVAEPGKPKEYRKGLVFSEAHPLVEDLNWQSLLAYKTFGIPMLESDEPLVWQANQPLIFLRHVPAGEPQLLVKTFHDPP